MITTITWPKIVLLSLYITGALIALLLGKEDSSEAIAYMLAGAAVNQGAVIFNGGIKDKGKKNNDS